MTKREFYTAISENETLSTEMRDFATAAIASLDATLAKRREKPSKAQVENAPLIDQIVGLLTSEPQTASDLAPKMEMKVQKASALLRAAVAQGRAISMDVKVKSKGTQKGYTLAD